MVRTHAMLTATARPSRESGSVTRKKTFAGVSPRSAACFRRIAGHRVKGRYGAKHVITHADINLRHHKGFRTVGHPQAQMFQSRADCAVGAKGQSEQDAQRERWQQNRDE